MTDSDPAAPSESSGSSASGWIKKGTFLLVIVGVIAFVRWRYGEYLNLEAIAERERQVLDWGRDHPVAVVIASLGIYIAVAGLSLPGAVPMTILIGWLFGKIFAPVPGLIGAVITVSFASTIGATFAFLAARYLLRETVQHRFGRQLESVNSALEREGAFYLFTARLIPFFPFFVINVVMGLTPMRTRTFFWVSQLGMLPGTILFVYTGWALPTLGELTDRWQTDGVFSILTPQIIVAFILLGLFPIVAKKTIARFRGVPTDSVGEPSPNPSAD